MAWGSGVYGQPEQNKVVAGIPVNYNEDKVGTYTLPDPLVMLNGRKVKNAKPTRLRRERGRQETDNRSRRTD